MIAPELKYVRIEDMEKNRLHRCHYQLSEKYYPK